MDPRPTIEADAAARVDRLFLFAFVPAFIFFAAAMYVRLTTDSDPLWSELAGPLLFALLGLRAVVRPTEPESRRTSRTVGYLLILVSAVLAALVIQNSMGAR